MTIASLSRLNLRQDGCRRALAALGRAVRRVADLLTPRWRPQILIPMNTGWMVTTPEDALRRWEAR
jgi:hypothetical protein